MKTVVLEVYLACAPTINSILKPFGFVMWGHFWIPDDPDEAGQKGATLTGVSFGRRSGF